MWQHSKIDEQTAMVLLGNEEEKLEAELKECKQNHKGQIQASIDENERYYNRPNVYENRIDNTDKRLTKIQEAFERVRNGTWGFCLVCHKEIPTERLEPRPWIEYCTGCKTKIESRQKMGITFIEPPSFSQLFPQKSFV